MANISQASDKRILSHLKEKYVERPLKKLFLIH